MLKQNNEINANNTTRNLAATNPMKRQNSGQSSNRISVRGSGKLRKPKENTENMSIYSKTKSKKYIMMISVKQKVKKARKVIIMIIIILIIVIINIQHKNH